MNSSRYNIITLILLLHVLIVTISANAEPNLASYSFKTGKKFRSAMKLPLTGNWKNAELRNILNRLSEEREIAVILDCRVNPNQKINIKITNLPLHRSFQTIASIAQINSSTTCDSVSIGDAVFVGERTSVTKLRTLIALRTNELADASSTLISKSRHRKLSQRNKIQWEDLTSPKEIISLIAKRYKLQVTGIDQIKHDLWAGGTFPNANAAEAFSMILIQCNRTFIWKNRGEEIEIVDIPEKVVVTQNYSLKKSTAKKQERLCQINFPTLPITLKGTTLSVVGTMAHQDQIDKLLHPEKYKTEVPAVNDPIKRRTFTLKIKNVPTSALMNYLKGYGIQFKYDKVLFQKKGIDFSKLITMDVKKAKADEFFNAIFTPLGLTFEIDDVTVLLKVK